MKLELSEEELKVVFESLENNRDTIKDFLEEHTYKEEERAKLQAEHDMAHNLMVRIGEHWTRSDKAELNRQADEAFEEWQAMSDVKSNGCLHGLSLSAILEYDQRMSGFAEKGRLLREQARATE